LWPHDLRPAIRSAVAVNPEHKLVVLDDDPTGTQTVYDVPVLTTWEVDTLRAELNGPHPCFYVLTNSRSLPADEARTLIFMLARNLRTAAGSRPCTLVSRSDSTLRGHFPLEPDALAEVFGPFDATFLIPYFEDGGRYTIEDFHYVADGDALIPAAETPFARDAAFGYRSSNLRDYVEEKSGGRVKASAVVSVALSDLRQGGPDAVTAILLALPRGSVCIVNAAAPGDLDVFVAGLMAAEAQGRRYCFRTAAQFPAARLGLERRPYLDADTLQLFRSAASTTSARPLPSREYATPQPILPPAEPYRAGSLIPPTEREGPSQPAARDPEVGGMLMVGSYVPKTTKQLAHLPDDGSLLRIELRVERLLTTRREETLTQMSSVIAAALLAQKDVVVFTSRRFVGGDNPAGSLAIGQRISDALVELVRRLEVRPRYLVAKGGITSSDLATRGLGVKRAMVLGQILPGVPVWRLGLETKFPGLPYVVFPGNVGGPTALLRVVTKLRSTG
jgi:uncharacterized protein YgbK (DUF1537 family)